MEPCARTFIMKKKNILESEFAWCFEGENPQQTFMLSSDESKKLWAEKIDPNNFHYFKLGNEAWVTQTDTQLATNWVDSYNDDQLEDTTNALNAVEECKEDDIIYFCLNGSYIIESNWAEFKKHWRCFLCIYDDCPIVLHASSNTIALIFSARGAIFIAKQ